MLLFKVMNIIFIYPLALLCFVLQAVDSIHITCGKSFLPCKRSENDPSSELLALSAHDKPGGPNEYTKSPPLYSGARLHGLKNAGSHRSRVVPPSGSENGGLSRISSTVFPISNQTLREAVVETEREVQVIYAESNAKAINISSFNLIFYVHMIQLCEIFIFNVGQKYSQFLFFAFQEILCWPRFYSSLNFTRLPRRPSYSANRLKFPSR